MIKRAMDRRKIVALGALALLAGCKVIPKGVPDQPPPPVEEPTDALPTDAKRHRVALLVPLSGANGEIGQSIANAASMAVLDTNAQNLRITTYDTATGATAAAAKAIADGNKLILGPIDGDQIAAVIAVARPAKVPIISYSNDAGIAAADVFVLGTVPSQSISRTVSYARAHGVSRFAALIPTGDYGTRASAAYTAAVRAAGGTIVATESYNRANTSVISAARRLRTKGGFDGVLIADGGRIASLAGPNLKAAGAAAPRILGTELWTGESVIGTTAALRGAWYSAISDGRYGQFSESYRTRFGAAPYRLATLGYDSVLLTLRVSRDWRLGTSFPTSKLADRGGFLGLDGPFRFAAGGVVERALEVRQVRAGGVTVASEAPARFND